MSNTNLIAKPVIKDQFWVITNGNEKVGNVLATGSGFEVKLNGTTKVFSRDETIENIVFQPLVPKDHKELPFARFPTTKKVFNSVFDCRRKLHLYTKSAQSKCLHAAGWFAIQNKVVFCPKYIFIQRYSYQGPYKTKDEAGDVLNMLIYESNKH